MHDLFDTVDALARKARAEQAPHPHVVARVMSRIQQDTRVFGRSWIWMAAGSAAVAVPALGSLLTTAFELINPLVLLMQEMPILIP